MGIIFFPCREKKLCIIVIICDLLRAQSIMWLLHPSGHPSGLWQPSGGTMQPSGGIMCPSGGIISVIPLEGVQ